MEKPVEKLIYGDLKGEALINFNLKLDLLKTEYQDFIIQNKIEFEDLYNYTINHYKVVFNISNKFVLESELGKKMNQAFNESFSHLFIEK